MDLHSQGGNLAAGNMTGIGLIQPVPVKSGINFMQNIKKSERVAHDNTFGFFVLVEISGIEPLTS